MKDLEWYLDLRGTKTGPFTALNIVEMFKAGKIPGTFKATAERLHGEWITVQELVLAFKELNQTPKSPWKADFNPPPRPTEQLEVASHTLYSEADQEFDPTASLFQAIRNLKDRANLTPKPSARDEQYEANARREPMFSPQAILVSVLGVLIFGAVFAMWQILKSNSTLEYKADVLKKENTEEVVVKKPPSQTAPNEPKINTESKLLSGGSGGTPAQTHAPIVNTRPEPAGGAAYENELPPEVLAEMQAAQEQDRASDPEGAARNMASKRKRIVNVPVRSATEDDAASAASDNYDDPDPSFDAGVAPEGT